MFEKLIENRIKQVGYIGAKVVDDTEDFTIPVSLPTEEGMATIVSITTPDTFTPGVPFTIKPKIRNDGGDDKLYLRIIDKDTGTELKHGYITLAAGKEYMPNWSITITQETDFHGKLEAGHVE